MRRIVSAGRTHIYHIRRNSGDVHTGIPNSVKAVALEKRKEVNDERIKFRSRDWRRNALQGRMHRSGITTVAPADALELTSSLSSCLSYSFQ